MRWLAFIQESYEAIVFNEFNIDSLFLFFYFTLLLRGNASRPYLLKHRSSAFRKV